MPMSGRGPHKNHLQSTRASNPADWEPSIRDLEIYAEIKKGRTYRDVAPDFDVSYSNVHAVCKKIDKWLRPQWMDEIRDVMTRQSEHLEHIFCEAMAAWELSKQDRITVTKKNDGTLAAQDEITIRREHNKLGDPKYLAEARKALADIRKIWGAETKASAFQGDDDGNFDPTGKSRDEARAEFFEQQAKLLRERAVRSEQLEPQAN